MKEITAPFIHEYCVAHSSNVHPIFQEIAKMTEERFPRVSHMQVGPLEQNFLSILTKLTRAKTILEFGTFTGNSSTAFAFALPKDGKITTLDRDPVATDLAKTFWEKAQVQNKIELILGDAKISVQTLIEEVSELKRTLYDLAFIDADKAAYLFYFESCLKLVRPGGAILVDNVLWSGYVLNPEDESDRRMASFNYALKNDPRIELVMLPIRDGVTVAIKT